MFEQLRELLAVGSQYRSFFQPLMDHIEVRRHIASRTMIGALSFVAKLTAGKQAKLLPQLVTTPIEMSGSRQTEGP